MRIISLDLLLGAPKLQRRIDAERALLRRNLAVVEESTQQLRAGAVRKATSLPALAAALATGFVVTKMAGRPRRPRPAGSADHEEKETSAASAALNASMSMAMQFLMPMLIGWVQARFAPQEPERESEDHPTEP